MTLKFLPFDPEDIRDDDPDLPKPPPTIEEEMESISQLLDTSNMDEEDKEHISIKVQIIESLAFHDGYKKGIDDTKKIFKEIFYQSKDTGK